MQIKRFEKAFCYFCVTKQEDCHANNAKCGRLLLIFIIGFDGRDDEKQFV
jgi:hypothetical protein